VPGLFDQALQRLGELLGLAEGGGDREDRAAGAVLGRGDRGEEDRAHRGGRAQVEGRDAVTPGITNGLGHHRIGNQGVDQTAQFHELSIQEL
jgi:hypothetical protein